MLNFCNYLQEFEGANAHDPSLEAEVRDSVLDAMNRIQRLHAKILDDKSAAAGQKQLSAAITELAGLVCIVVGVMTNDRVLILRGN